MQPKPGRGPMPFDCSRREIQRASGLIDGKAAEESHLDDATLLPIEPGQLVKRVVKSNHVHGLSLACKAFIEREPVASIPLCCFSAASVLHQNLPHQLRTDRDEMLTI